MDDLLTLDSNLRDEVIHIKTFTLTHHGNCDQLKFYSVRNMLLNTTGIVKLMMLYR